jgi:hypothetical protein
MTTGSCYPLRKEMKPWQQIAAMFSDYQKIVRDGLDPQEVHKAFLAIEEYRDVIALRLKPHAP